MHLHFLHTNDLHGKLTATLAEEISRKRGPETLCIDTGDCIRTGNLGIPLRPEAVWPLFASIPVDIGTIGNRETHVLSSAFWAKINGHQHPLVCCNMHVRGSGELVLPPYLILEKAGLRIGFIGVSVPMVTGKMASRAASSFIWSQPSVALARYMPEIQAEVDLLVCLSHLGYRRDIELAEKFPEIQIIFGGHSHTVLNPPEKHHETWIAQGGSHARYLGEYHWNGSMLSGGLTTFSESR